MHSKRLSPFILALIFYAGCGGSAEGNVTATTAPAFPTATLSPTLTPPPSQPAAPPAITPVITVETAIVPVEGTTTSEVNVRMEPSTASDSLGTIGIFDRVQIIGREASGNWYQVLYAESETGTGWLRAQYVQVNPDAEIRLVETGSGLGSSVSGVVTRGVNVRSEPDVESELLGVLNAGDVVSITGRDPQGKWLQIEFSSTAGGRGWITAEYVEAAGMENTPPIEDDSGGTVAPGGEPAAPAVAKIAATDGDSMQEPLAAITFSVTTSRGARINGDVSAPDGDGEDWVRFTSHSARVAIQLTCPEGNGVRMELWSDGAAVGEIACGGAAVAPGGNHVLRLTQNIAGYARYVLSLEVIP